MTVNSDQNEEPKNESSSSLSSSPASPQPQPPPPSSSSTLDTSSSSTTTTTTTTPSLMIGQTIANASDWINDNLMTVRYSVMATVGLLTFYGLRQTPLFFRYVSVAEIPAAQLARQKSLSCRLIQIHKHHQHRQQQESTTRISAGKRQRAWSSSSFSPTSPQQNHQRQVPIRMWVRHLSPVESWLFLSILPTSWFDGYMKMHPHATVTAAINSNRLPEDPNQRSKKDLLLVQVAGVDAPQSSSHYGSTPWLTSSEWIQKNLLENKQQSTLLTCQLLERQRLPRRLLKNPADKNVVEKGHGDEEEEQELDIAVVKVYFRQPNSSSFQLFSTDLAQYMVRNGIANPAKTFSSDEATEGEERAITSRRSTGVRTVDDKEKLKQRQQRRYQEMLQRAEMDAAKEARGMWSDPIVQQERRHVMDEVDFQATASTPQKLWRWIQQTWRRQQQRTKNKQG